MSEKAVLSKVGCVTFTRLLPGPIERVWQHLTDTTLLRAWFGEGKIEAREGGAVNLMRGHIRGTVTQCRPPHLLCYTWNVFNPGETISSFPESYLTLALEAKGEKVLLTLTHIPIPDEMTAPTSMGWHSFLDILEGTLRGETVKSRADYFEKYAALYGFELLNIRR